MGQLRDKPEDFQRGQMQLSAEALNKMVAIPPRQIIGDDDLLGDFFGDRVQLSNKKTDGIVPEIIAQFSVIQEFGDYILCAPFIQPNNGAMPIPQLYNTNLPQGILQLCVAKPYLLQQTPWDSQQVQGVKYAYTGVGQRTATGFNQVKSQAITPSYFPGDVILAIAIVTGYIDPNKVPIVWMDLNTGARVWASPLTYVSKAVCDPVTGLTVTYTTNSFASLAS